MTWPKIAIIGAGPAALTLARLLQYNSIPCQLYEKDESRHARTQGGTLDLHEGSAQLALREAGLYEEFLAHARPEGEVIKIYDHKGNVFMDEGRGAGEGRPEAMKNRPEIDRLLLRGMMLDSIDARSISWGKKLRSIDAREDGTFDLVFADSVETGFDLVVGADGAWSKVREFVSTQRPIYSGVGGLELHLTDVDNRHPEIGKHVGNGMCLNLGENRGLLAQRNGDGGAQLYAYVRVPETWYSEHKLEYLDPVTVKSHMLDTFFADWHQGAKNLVLKSDPEVFVRPLYMLPIGFKWQTVPGLTLIGDAAHLMTPFAGVGVNVGMQDALELSQAVIQNLHDRKGKSMAPPDEESRSSLHGAMREFEGKMWTRAEENAKSTWEFLGLFFNDRGPRAMIEHFQQSKAKENLPVASMNKAEAKS